MALLIVPRESWTQSSSSLSQNQPQPSTSNAAAGAASSTSGGFGALAELVDPSLRRKVAKDVNEAILQSQGERREANIRYLVRARAWAEQLARDKKMDLPDRLSLGLDGDETESSGSGTRERNGRDSNGHGADTTMAGDGGGRSTRRTTSGAPGGGGGGGRSGDTVMARYTNLPP